MKSAGLLRTLICLSVALEAAACSTEPAVPSSLRLSRHHSKQVEVFMASWCPHCQALEKFLQSHNVSYLRRDIERDPIGRRRYNELGRPGIPVTIVEGAVIVGYHPQEVLTELAR